MPKSHIHDRKKAPETPHKPVLQRSAINDEDVPQSVYDTLRSSGQPLDDNTRGFMEQRFGHDFSGVRVHTDGQAAESAHAVNAHAYTVGRDVAFGAGRYAPATAKGRSLLAHELTHVVQQNGQPVLSSGLSIAPSNSDTERAAQKNANALGYSTLLPNVKNRISPIELARDEEETSTGGLTTLQVSGDKVRSSPPAGVPIRNGSLNWTLEYKGAPTTANVVNGQIQMGLGKDVEMSVTFTPSQGAGGCPTITFIQIVRATTGGMQDTPRLLSTQDASGFSPDVSETETEPYYGLAGMPSSQGTGLNPDMGSSVAGTAPNRSQQATFGDAPLRASRLIPPGQTTVREFEVAVICVETGDTFGSIRWGYTKTSNGVITLTGAQPSDVNTQSASPTVETARQAYYSGFFQQSLSGFARGSASLTQQHRNALQQIASQANIRQIVLVGGNDFSGGPEANAALSRQRAEAARNHLVQLGFDPQHIQIEGQGVTARQPNRQGQQVAANRRVDIHIERGRQGLIPQTQGSALEGMRFRRQYPRKTYEELVDLLLTVQSGPRTVPESVCNQFTHMTDGLDRWRRVDPTVPDVHTHYGPLIRQLRSRCVSRIPRQRPEFELTPLQPPNFLDRIGESTHEEPF